MLEVIETHSDAGLDWYEEARVPGGCAILVVMAYGKCVYWVGSEGGLDERGKSRSVGMEARNKRETYGPLHADKIVLGRGDFLLIPSGSAYYGKSVPTVFHEKFVFTLSYGRASADALPMSLFAGPGHAFGKPGFYELGIDRLRTAMRERAEGLPYADVRLQAAVLDTMALWCRELERTRRTDTERHAERMKAFIHEHYREKITKRELGAAIGRSPNHAAALFRRATGMTISGYVHHVRTRTAIYLLKESLLTVAEIAESLGYQDVSYFQRTFKRTTGQPPSSYLAERRRH